MWQYSSAGVKDTESKIDANITSLLTLIESKYQTTNLSFDFGHTAMFLALDTISDVAHSSPLGFLATNSDCFRLVQTIEKQVPKITVLNSFPWVYEVFKWPLLNRLAPSPKDKVGMGALMG